MSRCGSYAGAFLGWVFWNKSKSLTAFIVMQDCLLSEIIRFSVYIACELLYDKVNVSMPSKEVHLGSQKWNLSCFWFFNLQVEDSLDASWMNIPWHKLSPTEMRIFLIIMAQQAPELKAGGIYPLTFEGYKNLASDIYSQLTVLDSLVN